MNDPKSIATGIIRAEHRALAAVINSIKSIVAEIRAERMSADFRLLWSMIHYIDAFPERLHHPKEDAWLFARIQERTRAADSLIETLLEQHSAGEAELQQLRKALGNFEAGVPGALESLDEVVRHYAEFTWRHMSTEEHELLPIGETCLTQDDWADIARAFQENCDPLAGAQEGAHLLQLFRQIVERTPAPMGLGTRQAS
ncbi:MAG TPA: hemerythrin domain-containing protein [Xanthomonadaceae bacterium]|nr:hemerythrin domain-containing protein [Xanthomonadaceae bacterium]